jgi:peroxiredoxin (alkyl hydroperoxide reductase subunit C)
MAEPIGCARPTGRVVGETGESDSPAETPPEKEVKKMAVQVGRKAPDFEAPAYHKGGFTSVKLSESLGHWVMLCFYPGDFTFV